MKLHKPVFALLFLTLTSCVSSPPPEPEGPGEMIGKGIDQITKGLQEIEKDSRAQEDEERKRRARRNSYPYPYESETGYADQFPSEPYESRGR